MKGSRGSLWHITECDGALFLGEELEDSPTSLIDFFSPLDPANYFESFDDAVKGLPILSNSCLLTPILSDSCLTTPILSNLLLSISRSPESSESFQSPRTIPYPFWISFIPPRGILLYSPFSRRFCIHVFLHF
jgi:hypothetical protein